MSHPEDDIAVAQADKFGNQAGRNFMDDLRASIAEHRAREHAAEDAEWREHYRDGGAYPAADDEPDYEDEFARRLDDDYADDGAERRYERQIYGD